MLPVQTALTPRNGYAHNGREYCRAGTLVVAFRHGSNQEHRFDQQGEVVRSSGDQCVRYGARPGVLQAARLHTN